MTWRTKRVISKHNLLLANKRLTELAGYKPVEFQRTLRSFTQLSYWRAHEFRQFLLYTWYTVFHDILPEKHCTLFRVLHVYTRLLADPSKVENEGIIDYTIELAKLFNVLSCELFGDQWAIYNVHGLLHVPQDVFKFGCTEKVSCFKFEAFMFTLKHLVRSGRNPLKQAINRYVTHSHEYN